MTSVWIATRKILATLIALAWLGGGGAVAQEPKSFTQIKLSEDNIKSFIKAQTPLAEIAPKIQAAGDSPDPGLQTELESLAKTNGFTDFAELDNVAGTIALVMAGLDSQSGEYVDPYDALQKELDDVKKDAGIPEADKTQLVEELNATIKTTPPLQHKENVDVVKAHRADIEKALQ
ncbi:MAG: hypothetical protein ACKVP4_05660 [Hyphomicrobium sp.]